VHGSRFSPGGCGVSLRRVRADVLPGRRPRLQRLRVRLGDGARTTLHVVSYELSHYAPRVVAFERPVPLARWCKEAGVRHAVVGGFFQRPDYAPLGELRIGGVARSFIPFDEPWGAVRACVQIHEDCLRVARRDQIEARPSGDLVQAGPLLVAGGRVAIPEGQDLEGFSAGARQFDSDITIGRYPRAALALTGERALAVACDGRTHHDAGMTLSELAQTLIELGAHDAINLDGGGSASLVHQGRLRNRPREAHGVDVLGGRPVVTAIVFDTR
jgi:Phosphodiester glycosidase